MWIVSLLLLAACGASRQEEPTGTQNRTLPSVVQSEVPDYSSFTAEARAATNRLQLDLKQELAAAIADGGAASAVEVCSRRATELTAEVSARTGMQVRRVSVRNRNPANRATTGEASVLAMMATRADLADTTIVRDGVPFYVRAIRINTSLCLQCHGDVDELGDGVAEQLSTLYENDRATGFAEGDLRGAFVVRPGS